MRINLFVAVFVLVTAKFQVTDKKFVVFVKLVSHDTTFNCDNLVHVSKKAVSNRVVVKKNTTIAFKNYFLMSFFTTSLALNILKKF